MFIGLQFFCATKPWNFVNAVTVLVEDTSFGTNNDNAMAIIDSVLGMSMLGLLRLLWSIKPWDKSKLNNDKTDRVERYIIENNLY